MHCVVNKYPVLLLPAGKRHAKVIAVDGTPELQDQAENTEIPMNQRQNGNE